MPYNNLNLGATADPLVSPTATQISKLLECGALNLGLLNGILKLLGASVDTLGTKVDALEWATDNRVSSASYNAATNILTLSLIEGEQVAIDMSPVLNDFAASSAIPAGTIWPFKGTVAPAGWAICDGTNGTDDLRGRYLYGATALVPLGTSFGSATHDHTGNTGDAGGHDHGAATGGHALTIAEMPSHNHGNGVGDQIASSMIHGTQPASASTNMNNDSSSATLEGLTSSDGGGAAHTHAITGAADHKHTVAAANHLPPSFAVNYIIKL